MRKVTILICQRFDSNAFRRSAGIMLGCLLAITCLQAQQEGSQYARMIREMEGNGINVRSMMNNPDFSSRMKADGYSRDSFEHYLNLLYPLADSLDESVAPYLALMGKAYRDSIILRWGPSSGALWRKLNRSGYMLLRYEAIVDREGFVSGPDTNTLLVLVDSAQAIRPWPLERIARAVAPSDSAAMIAAQALYGDRFGPDSLGGGLDFMARNNDQNMRFGFAMMMADRSALAAELLGLRYCDKNVKPGKHYLYYIFPVENSLNLANFHIIQNDPSRNAKPLGLEAVPGDQLVQLRWPRSENNYSEYWVERSADQGKNWVKLSKEPMVFIERDGVDAGGSGGAYSLYENPAEEAARYYIVVDSTSNGRAYRYRVSGQTPFGDYTDYAYVDAKSSDLTAPPVPLILKNEVDEKSNIASIEWSMDYDAELLADLDGFSVWRGPHPDSAFVQISTKLPASARRFSTADPLDKNQLHYFILKARDKSGNEALSFPVYMHVIDETPPAAPQNPAYTIDSTGRVTLVWKHNTEPDLLGYRVYFSHALHDEASQLTPEPVAQNIFRDSVELISLSEIVYYWIQAVDRSHNRSAFSKVIEVKKPDLLPPSAPMLKSPLMNDSLIELHWRPSSSRDVVYYHVYRRLYLGDEPWQEIAQRAARDTLFTDFNAPQEKLWEYSLRAQDDAGLFSEYAFPVKGRRWYGGTIPGVENLQAAYDSSSRSVILKWTFTPPQEEIFNGVGYKFYLFRGLDGAPLTRYRILEGEKTTCTDPKTEKSGDYRYAVKVVFLNGKSSALSPTLSVPVKRN